MFSQTQKKQKLSNPVLEYLLVSFNKTLQDKKVYSVNLEGNTFKKIKKRSIHLKYYDYKISKNFEYEIETKNNIRNKEVDWEDYKLGYRIRFYEEFKKRYLFVYTTSEGQAHKIVNTILLSVNMLNKKTEPNPLTQSINLYKAKNFHEVFFQKLKKLSKIIHDGDKVRVGNEYFKNTAPSTNNLQRNRRSLELVCAFLLVKGSQDFFKEYDVELIHSKSNTNRKPVPSFAFNDFDKIFAHEKIEYLKSAIKPSNDGFLKEILTLKVILLNQDSTLGDKYRFDFNLIDKNRLVVIDRCSMTFEHMKMQLENMGLLFVQFSCDRILLITSPVFEKDNFDFEKICNSQKLLKKNTALMQHVLEDMEQNLITLTLFNVISEVNLGRSKTFLIPDTASDVFDIRNMQVVELPFEKLLNKTLESFEFFTAAKSSAEPIIRITDQTRFSRQYCNHLVNIFITYRFSKSQMILKTLDQFRYSNYSTIYSILDRFAKSMKERVFIYSYMIVLFLDANCKGLFEAILSKRREFFFDLLTLTTNAFFDIFDEKMFILFFILALRYDCTPENSESIYRFFFVAFCVTTIHNQNDLIQKFKLLAGPNQSQVFALFKGSLHGLFEQNFKEKMCEMWDQLFKATSNNFMQKTKFYFQNIFSDVVLEKNFVMNLFSKCYSERQKELTSIVALNRDFDPQHNFLLGRYYEEKMSELIGLFPIKIRYGIAVNNSLFFKDTDFVFQYSFDGNGFRQIGNENSFLMEWEDFVNVNESLQNKLFVVKFLFQISRKINNFNGTQTFQVIERVPIILNYLKFFRPYKFTIRLEERVNLALQFTVEPKEMSKARIKKTFLDYYYFQKEHNVVLIRQISRKYEYLLRPDSIIDRYVEEQGKVEGFKYFLPVKNLFAKSFVEKKTKSLLFVDYLKFLIYRIIVNGTAENGKGIQNAFDERFMDMLSLLPITGNNSAKVYEISEIIGQLLELNQIFLSNSYIEMMLLNSQQPGQSRQDSVLAFIFCLDDEKPMVYQSINISEEISQLLFINSITFDQLTINLVDSANNLTILHEILSKEELSKIRSTNFLVIANPANVANLLKIDFNQKMKVIKGTDKSFELELSYCSLTEAAIRALFQKHRLFASLFDK